MDKRGIEITISTVILLILGLLVLGIMIFLITSSSNSFMENVKSFFSYSNVDSVVNSCNMLAGSEITYKYCCEKNLVKYYVDGEKEKSELSCFELLNKSFASNLNELNCGEIKC